MKLPDGQLLRIPNWFDAARGFEPMAHGRAILGPLERYVGRIHTGEIVGGVIAAHGPDVAARCVFVFDRLCQLTAAQPIQRRGLISDARGRPYDTQRLAAEIGVKTRWLDAVLERMLELGWIELVDAAAATAEGRRRRDGAAVSRRTGDDDATMSGQRRDDDATMSGQRRDADATLSGQRRDDDATMSGQRRDDDATLSGQRRDADATLSGQRRDNVAPITVTVTADRQNSCLSAVAPGNAPSNGDGLADKKAGAEKESCSACLPATASGPPAGPEREAIYQAALRATGDEGFALELMTARGVSVAIVLEGLRALKRSRKKILRPGGWLRERFRAAGVEL